MTRHNLKISVIIPVYNAADLLPRAVGSVLMQDFSDMEVILVDDGSTDDSAFVCDELAQSDMRVRVIRKSNGGVSSARNAGLDVAKGEYVMFLDADDAIGEDALSMMCQDEADFVLAGFEKSVDGKLTESYKPKNNFKYQGVRELCSFFDDVLPRENTYILNSACFKLFRRSILLEKNIRFVEGLSFAEDKLFVMSFLEHVQSVCTVSAVVYTYYIRHSSLSSDMVSDRHVCEIIRLLECYFPVLKNLEVRYAGSSRLMSLYHRDLVGRYVCRILGIFATRKSGMLTKDNVGLMYHYIKEDRDAGVFNLRLGQVPNMILYRIGNPGFTVNFYRFTSFVASGFRLNK